MGIFEGHGPKTVGAICNPANFSDVIEVPPSVLGPRDGFVAVDLIEPGCKPLELFNPVSHTRVLRSRPRGLWSESEMRLLTGT
jgi:hypothetical protein